MKKLKEKFKKYVTKQNVIIAGIIAVVVGTVLHLGGWDYLKGIFSSRAGGNYHEVPTKPGEKPIAPKDISKLRKLSSCSDLFPWGPPEVKDKSVNDRSLFLCRKSYSVQYDPAIKQPVWEVEILKKANQVAFNIPKSFGPELDPDLPDDLQASLGDYINSGYSFGFLAPVQNMYQNIESLPEDMLEKVNEQALKQSYYMTNAIPVTSNVSLIMKQIESQSRTIVQERDPLYLVSGPVFLNGKTNGFIGKNKIPVPTHIYKIITYPLTHGSIAYLIPNENLPCGNNCSAESFIVPIKEVERVTSIEFYSKLAPFYAVQVKRDVNELLKKQYK